MSLSERYFQTMNRIAKWRNVFAGWQLGTRSRDDPEFQAVKDHREITIILRVEMTATTKILMDKGICTLEEIQQAVIDEANLLDKDYQERFTGMKATDIGIDFNVVEAVKGMGNWKK